MAGTEDVASRGALRALLLKRRDDVQRQLAQMQAPAEDAGGIAFGKRVGDATSVAVERIAQVAAHDPLRQMLRDVEHALARLDEGSYGTCERCGRQIPDDRLAARPWAVTCISCSA